MTLAAREASNFAGRVRCRGPLGRPNKRGRLDRD
jgi:hypothetical protein